MSQEQPAKPFKDMSGYLAKNTKRTKESQPHLTGKVRIRGEEFLISVWEKEDKPGLMNVSITDPKTMPGRPNAAPASSSTSSGNTPPSSQSDDMFGDIFGSLGA